METIFKEINVITNNEYQKILNTNKMKNNYFEPNQVGQMVYYFDLDMSFDEADNLVTELNKIDDGWFVVDEDIDDDDAEMYFQPMITFKGKEFFPQELYSFQVFPRYDMCKEWLKKNGYDLDLCKIVTYFNDDIEEHIYINADGEVSARNLLDEELQDDDTDFGGTSFNGETVSYFLDDVCASYDISVEELNGMLKECGIEPFE